MLLCCEMQQTHDHVITHTAAMPVLMPYYAVLSDYYPIRSYIRSYICPIPNQGELSRGSSWRARFWSVTSAVGGCAIRRHGFCAHFVLKKGIQEQP